MTEPDRFLDSGWSITIGAASFGSGLLALWRMPENDYWLLAPVAVLFLLGTAFLANGFLRLARKRPSVTPKRLSATETAASSLQPSKLPFAEDRRTDED